MQIFNWFHLFPFQAVCICVFDRDCCRDVRLPLLPGHLDLVSGLYVQWYKGRLLCGRLYEHWCSGPWWRGGGWRLCGHSTGDRGLQATLVLYRRLYAAGRGGRGRDRGCCVLPWWGGWELHRDWRWDSVLRQHYLQDGQLYWIITPWELPTSSPWTLMLK